MYNVLIVDEEEHLLWALEQNLFPDRDDINIVTATDGERGLDVLENEPVDLLVSDIKMPGTIDGFQLILRAKEVAPDARVIIMTAFGTNRIQNFADRIGITHYIEKPFNTDELRDAVLEILDEKEGFQGVLSDLELTDIIQMLCLAKRTALLHLKHKDHRGKIIFEKGDVIHAEFDGNTGEEAVFEMLALRQGDIFMQSDFENDEHTIDIGWQDLLFEGVKRADEQRHAEALEEDDEEDGPNTDVGMGVAEKVDELFGESNEEEGLAEQSFFSEAELREIEQASEDAIEEAAEEDDEEDDDSTDADLADAVGEEESGGTDEAEAGESGEEVAESEPLEEEPTVLAEEVSSEAMMDEVDEFRAPFQEPDDSEPDTTSWVAQQETKRQIRSIPPDESSAEIDIQRLEAGGFEPVLEEFALECPGLKITGIIARDEGLPLNFVEVHNHAGYDPEAIAAFFSDVALAASRTVAAFGSDGRYNVMQLALDNEYVLLRQLKPAPYVHIAVVERDASLGVALVMMRRFQKKIYQALKD